MPDHVLIVRERLVNKTSIKRLDKWRKENETFVRMGIDVGGTHTKAVAIDNATHEIIGKSSVKTTHDDVRGVAAGVVQSFKLFAGK